MRQGVVLFSLLAGLCVPVNAAAQAASSTAPSATAAVSPGDLQFTGPELAQLFQAVANIQTSPDIEVSVSSKPASEMPSYDPTCHYAGITTEAKGKTANVWCVSSAPSGAALREAMAGALMLAVMDYGFAGPKWKTTYDVLAAKDAALPESEVNRYANRLLVEQQLLKFFDQASQKPKS